MKFGVREICDVVLRAKAAQKIGNKVFYKNEPVIYFDSLKTSSMEGQATTVYAQGGRGNARLMAWEGERTVTFTMEDALISPVSFSILSGAGLIESGTGKPVITHVTETTTVAKASDTNGTIYQVEIALKENPYLGSINNTQKTDPSTSKKYYEYTVDNDQDFIYVMLLDENGEVCSEPYIPAENKIYINDNGTYSVFISTPETTLTSDDGFDDNTTNPVTADYLRRYDLSKFKTGATVLVDYYVAHETNAYQINITPDKFGGNFYLEASTLFRAQNGVDMPAEFIIPNCKIQSNFTFTMASSGDPSTFTFTMDAFPDYTRWDTTQKVFAAIQVINKGETNADFERLGTPHNGVSDAGTILDNTIKNYYDRVQKPTLED